MTSGHDGASDLRGDQTPRISSVPPYVTSAGHEAIDLIEMAGLKLDPWQQSVLIDGMGESGDWKCPFCTHRTPGPTRCPEHPRASLIHPWSAFEVTLVVPRQNGKSELLIARMLAGAFLLEEPLQIFSAHLFDTAMEIFGRLCSVIDDCDELRAQVKLNRGKVGMFSHGQEGITLKTGERIRFKARSGGGGRGFSCDTLYLDEAMILPERFLGATVPTLSARPNPQMWLAGSAPDAEDPSHDGVVLSRRRLRATAGGDTSLAYAEFSADFDGDPSSVPASVLDSPREWARSSPGLGRRITPETVANERSAMGVRQFAIERLGIGGWSNLDEDAGRILAAADWAHLRDDPDSRIAQGHVFAFDVDNGQAWATLAAAGEREDGLFHVGVVEHRRGTGWLVDSCRSLLLDFPGSVLVCDPRADLGALLLELNDAGIQPVRTTAGDYKDACGGFYQAVLGHRLRYRSPQVDLDNAVEAARTRPLLDAWKWDRASGAVITPLIAVTLALWGARTQGAPTVWDLSEFVGDNAAELFVPELANALPAGFVPLDAVPMNRSLFRP